MNAGCGKRRWRRDGMVLVIVLVVVVVLTLAAYTFTNLMLTHNEAARLRGRQIQARVLIDSGVELVRYFLMQDPTTLEEAGGHYNNPLYFQGVMVLEDVDPAECGSVTVLAPELSTEEGTMGVRYGLEDESSRLNLNIFTLAEMFPDDTARDFMMALPGMTEEIADAILDWIDEDDEPRELGAEIEYYATLEPAYAPKNAPLDTVEELLLVRDVTPQLLFGLDVNRNGLIDTHEMAGQAYGGQDLGSQMALEVESYGGSLDRGWSAYLTLYSKEKNVNSLGEPRIDLSTEDMNLLYEQLTAVFDEEWATFIVAYRQNGPYEEEESGGGGGGAGGGEEAASGGELDLEQPASEKGKINKVLDLIGKKVQVQFKGAEDPTVLESPFTEDQVAMLLYLPTLMDNVSAHGGETIPYRININQCSEAILEGVLSMAPDLTEEAIDAIFESRATEPEDEGMLANQQHETWLLAYGLVTLEQMKTLSPYACAGGDVFRAQVVGYYQEGAASARAEVVIDATTPTPQLLLWRDISHLGRGYPLEILGVQLLDGLPQQPLNPGGA